jgi:hypothetical protein
VDGALIPVFRSARENVYDHTDGREAKNVFVETTLSDDGILASDHRSVVVDIVVT